ncbi:MAG: ATP-dependent DNA helicase [Alphaproteobacteria bacterium]|nr:ATP-dependent DNA helicase [Alphaproteobacteria bacterium]
MNTLKENLKLPDAPALISGVTETIWLSQDGEVEHLPFRAAEGRLRQGAFPMVCHARATWRKIGNNSFRGYDLLELFAFVRPAVFCVPTPSGLAESLNLPHPIGPEEQGLCLFDCAHALLTELAKKGINESHTLQTAWTLSQGGWSWGPAVLSALGASGDSPHSQNVMNGFKPWLRMKDWGDFAPEPPASHDPVSPEEAISRLEELLGENAEQRPQQVTYTQVVAQGFEPREKEEEPRLVIAEAGTGVGKTLGYISPSSIWAQKNKGAVWISTFTRNLQRQLNGELDKLYPNRGEKMHKVVVRKGRENYLCLLNLEDAVNQLSPSQGNAIALGLMSRWAGATRDGDMIGGDFPGWLADLIGRTMTIEMTDTRGECIFSACKHYNKCFIEKSVRRAKRAEIVVANHALVLIQAAMGDDDEAALPTRYVFDEGHHLFGAADSAFSADLTGYETADLRRWLLGPEGNTRSRARGLRKRIEDVILSEEATDALEEVLRAARALPAPAWGQRLAGGAPAGTAENFLSLVRQQVYAREKDTRSPYSLEAEVKPPIPGLPEAAFALESDLARLTKPVLQLIKALQAQLDDEADEMESQSRQRLNSVSSSLERRALMPLRAWQAMLNSLKEETPEEFVDWLSVERRDGRDVDVGMHRHWIDPTIPLAKEVFARAHGVVVTSATLKDEEDDSEEAWGVAARRTGTTHLPSPLIKSTVKSPFDYPNCTKIFVVTDLMRNNLQQTAAAYRELFVASGGGALGLFTAINRLRTVYDQIAPPLEAAGIPLLAQHIDALDTGTLTDIFRAEEHACLLGTDAVRDGVDVPGNSLRLMVFDRVPWPRPTILHKARKQVNGKSKYDEMLTRLKLKQAFGRLIRRADDRAVFVMLDKALPTRLTTAFPEGVEVQRLGLAEVVKATEEFLN